MLLEDVLKEFIFDCKVRNLSERTIKEYKNNNLKFFKFIEGEFKVIELDGITHHHIKFYFKYLKDKGLKESYINNLLKNIRAFYKYCIDEEYILKNPCLKVKWQKEKKSLIQAFEDEEVKRMLNVYNFSNYLNARNKTIIAFLIDTGARNQEICYIEPSDIKDQFLVIHGKGNKERYIAITPHIMKYMIKYERIRQHYFKDKTNKDNNYFLSRTGKKLTVETIQNIVRKAGEEANVRKEIRCSPHVFRHYFSQTQLKNGLDVYSLSRILGHEDITITKRYLLSLNDKEILKMSVKTSPLANLK